MIINMFTIKISKVIWQVWRKKGQIYASGCYSHPLKNLVISCQIDNMINSVQNMDLTTERYIVTCWQSLYTSGEMAYIYQCSEGWCPLAPDHQFEKEQQ